MSKQITVLGKRVESKILLIRGQRVILDTDLAELYGVSTKQLNQQVKRNARRFPDDFVVQLSAEEAVPATVGSATGLTRSLSTAPLWLRQY
jgi:hypothetical protein